MKEKLFPISMTILWGITFSYAMHDWTLGICMGLLMGIVFGLFDSDNKKTSDNNNNDIGKNGAAKGNSDNIIELQKYPEEAEDINNQLT